METDNAAIQETTEVTTPVRSTNTEEMVSTTLLDNEPTVELKPGTKKKVKSNTASTNPNASLQEKTTKLILNEYFKNILEEISILTQLYIGTKDNKYSYKTKLKESLQTFVNFMIKLPAKSSNLDVLYDSALEDIELIANRIKDLSNNKEELLNDEFFSSKKLNSLVSKFENLKKDLLKTPNNYTNESIGKEVIKKLNHNILLKTPFIIKINTQNKSDEFIIHISDRKSKRSGVKIKDLENFNNFINPNMTTEKIGYFNNSIGYDQSALPEINSSRGQIVNQTNNSASLQPKLMPIIGLLWFIWFY